MGTDVTNTFLLKFFIYHQNCGRHKFRRFVGFRRGVAYSRNKGRGIFALQALRTRLRNLALRTKRNKLALVQELQNLNLKSQFSIRFFET